MDGWFFHLGLHHSTFGMDFIIYFVHHVTPLTSHIRGNLLQLILPHMVNHTLMAFPITLYTLWTPWTNIIPFMFPISSLKIPIIFCTQPLIPFSCIYARKGLKVMYGNYRKKGMILETSKVQKWSMGSKESTEGQGRP